MIGRLVDGRYQVRSRIARGGMATVYLATDLRLERRVALKIMHGHLADDGKFRERFIQEARSAARLAHPNVVNVFDQGQDSEMAYLVMEYLPGITLRDLLQERHVLTTEQVFDILEAVLSGLAAAHKAGIVHRDLKPENVLLADDGRIKIGDFGLARAASANTATGAALLGTIAYLSPELVTRGIADTRSDIYAVGIMTYEMLAGEQPFKGEQPMQIAYQHANDSVPSPSMRNPRIPAELDELVLWATARNPEERPRDARAMLDQLRDTRTSLSTALPTGSIAAQKTMLLSGEFEGSDEQTQVLGSGAIARSATGQVSATTSLTTRSERRRKRSWWLVAAVVLLTGLAGGTGWYFGTGPGSLTTIPSSIVGGTPAAATAALTDLGLSVADSQREVFDPDIDAGKVAGTNPAVGTAVARDGVVTILVSKGPKPVDMPLTVGLDEETAKKNVTDAGLLVDEKGRVEQFSSKTAAGVVLAAYGVDGDGKEIKLNEGDGYFDKRQVHFVVSVGPLPDVTRESVADATSRLKAAGVTAVEGSKAFSDSVPAGTVIKVVAEKDGDPIHPGDTVKLIVSKGVDLVAIPDIVGKSINDATQLLKKAGFTVKVDSDLPPDYWQVQKVDSYTPDDGSGKAKRGIEITIKARVH
jgi:eukaryotic-like serine/threonine-protein kinase